MKYKILTQIGSFLQQFRKISSIKRVNDRVLLVDFGKSYRLNFDMDKTNSSVYIDENLVPIKEYKAPFDGVLAKRFNASDIEKIEVMKGNRILLIKASKSGSYKKIFTNIYFEFTGRFTNVIITDEDSIILEALSHYENDHRAIKVGEIYTMLKPIDIKEKAVLEIGDFKEFFIDEFRRLNDKKLESVKISKLTQISKKIENLELNLSNLESKDELLEKSKNISNLATIITANLHTLKEFDREFTLKDFSGKSISFKIDEPPKIHTKNLFNESKKLKQKAAGIEQEAENLTSKLEFYNSLKELITHAKSINELEILLPKRSSKKSYEKEHDNVENFYFNEYKISVGKNEKGNEFLLKNSKKNDFWFHLKDIPSSHVIVKTNKQSLTPEVIEFAAKVCINFSVKGAGKYAVDFTRRSNVKVRQKAFVNYDNYDTITLDKP
ncbi:NFACT RNA binding domain-containing protein [Campylobacter corcagiensis]|uniref:DUF814 domain-containing protein n=1 Tax=Campylobacter corcagiensis TaxID=1448857 RepID=A0A7M1LHD5_9BACT|nr:NFACT RNA binding domain-containing protein [Campylobacter corcagiensis]QOQ87741.1 DUF814 domain-containing protein [Campylobacter corcagiensis]